jgi:RHS repeat-associated protein
MNGLDLYDFHARQYDPVLGRFTTPVPLSEKYYHISPSAYCANNPIKLIDIDGKEWADNQNNVIENTSN